MSRKPAIFIAGLITAVVMVLVLGVAASANANQSSAVAATSSTTSTSTAGVCVNPADVVNLQAQLNDYQAALQQANAQLQAAYNQITVLQQGRFSGEREGNEGSGRFVNPFGGQ